MKSKQTTAVFILFSLCMALALLGGTWQTASAVGTVPVTPPTNPVPPLPPVIPVTGTCVGEIIKVEDVSLCIPDGAVDKKYKAALEIVTDVPGSAQINALTPVVNVYLKDGVLTLPEYKFVKEALLTIKLSTATVDLFKKNPLVALMHYDLQTKKWVKMPVTVLDNQALVSISSSGLYVLAIPQS